MTPMRRSASDRRHLSASTNQTMSTTPRLATSFRMAPGRHGRYALNRHRYSHHNQSPSRHSDLYLDIPAEVDDLSSVFEDYSPEHTKKTTDFEYSDPTDPTFGRRASNFSLVTTIRPDYERRFESLGRLLTDFCGRTSSHGVPHIGECQSTLGKVFWTTVFVLCSIIFLAQTAGTLSEYFEYKTIIEMQLRFEAAPFPAVTVCNLNPFKMSKVVDIEEIQRSLQMHKQSMNTMAQAIIENPAFGFEHKDDNDGGRVRRQVLLTPVIARCACNIPGRECVPVRSDAVSRPNASVCMCFMDELSSNIWPCYPTTTWTEELCSMCSVSNGCPYPLDKRNITGHLNTPCLCQLTSNFCMMRPKGAVPWWKPKDWPNAKHYTITHPPMTTTTTASTEIKQAYGLDDPDRKDSGSKTVRTKENIIYIVASLPRDVRISVGYSLQEFVRWCSFNSKDCNLDRDFLLHVDPEYGNCFTFNFNNSVEKNSRAGPMYGLRLLLDVNQTEYLPVTEAAGVRLVIHEQIKEPFPDTFGYNAPVGFKSSFGLKTKQVHRMGPPYGQCREDGLRDYVYEDPNLPSEGNDTGGRVQYRYRYDVTDKGTPRVAATSLESCYRSCFQHLVIEECGCGAPKYPMPASRKGVPEARVCDAGSAWQRGCIQNVTEKIGGYYNMKKGKGGCSCVQPCHENLFETAYSSAGWPANNYDFGPGDCANIGGFDSNDSTACLNYYRYNSVLLEIFYEQLNYESLKETKAYSLTAVLSDFGGNIGLWIGFSAITFVEWIELLLECCYYFYHKHQKEARIKRIKMDSMYSNRIHNAQLRQDATVDTDLDQE